MSDKMGINDHLSKFGDTLIENGYNIVPIQPGKKAPGFDGWSKIKATKTQLKTWLDNGHARDGVGIITKYTPAIDIDVTDPDVVAKISEWCEENIGSAPARVGKNPKRLLVYRCDEPFKKMKSAAYKDEWGDKQQVEILADGQQFVAFAIHPGTLKPYEWITGETPLNTLACDLPVLTEEKAAELIKWFDAMAEKLGWESMGGAKQPKSGAVERDAFAADVEKVTMDDKELRNRLLMVPGNDNYDTWVEIGMALFHQFDGEDVGRDLWHEWSETADNYDADALDRKWSSFDIGNKGRAPITARVILKRAKDAVESIQVQTTVELRDEFAFATTLAEWREIAKRAKRAEIDHLARNQLADIAKKQYEKIANAKITLGEVKKAISYEVNHKDMPRWVKDWVYDGQDDKFFNLQSKYSLTRQGFKALNDRYAMTKKDILDGKTAPSSDASDLALNLYKIPNVQGKMYAPGRDSVFVYGNVQMANTYSEDLVPEAVEPTSARDKAAIRRVLAHLAHLLPDPSEQVILLDWLSYVVQNPGKRVNWAILLQGVEGDGKSFFAHLLRAVMGFQNVQSLSGSVLENPFTGWAHGQCVTAMEEVRLIGHNRYDVMNTLKPLITNDTVTVHAKGKDPYDAENTTSYMLFTNYRDALPLKENERRYCVLFSQWQNRDLLVKWMESNEDYYERLYECAADSAGALRYWLLNHEQSATFKPRGNAPLTPAFWSMVHESTPDEMKAIYEVINEANDPEISEDLLCIGKLTQVLYDRSANMEMPKTKEWSRLLSHAGFWSLGQVRIEQDRRRYWSKRPEKFTSDGRQTGEASAFKIRRYVQVELERRRTADEL